MTIQEGLPQILHRYPNRQIWEKESRRDKRSYEAHLDDIAAESSACVKVVEQRSVTILVRQTLIRNNHGDITPEMARNQEEWQRYILRIGNAQKHVRQGFNWLELLMKESDRREDALIKFWGKLVYIRCVNHANETL